MIKALCIQIKIAQHFNTLVHYFVLSIIFIDISCGKFCHLAEDTISVDFVV